MGLGEATMSHGIFSVCKIWKFYCHPRMSNLYPNHHLIFFYQTFEGLGSALWLCQAIVKVFSCSELPGLISPIVFLLARMCSWPRLQAWQETAGLAAGSFGRGGGERGKYLIYCLGSKGCFFFSKTMWPRTEWSTHSCRRCQWLGHTSKAHLPGEEQNCHLQISGSFMLVSESLKVFLTKYSPRGF